jgi:glycosyltransferase involved in cell wall biosynthesis
MISVLILTKNEQADLPECLASVAWCDDVHVLDSFSNDATVSIAMAAGAKVRQRMFDGYASQRNFGLREIEFRHPWVLLLDADERVAPGLVSELRGFVQAAPATTVAARLRRRDYWQGRWLAHAQISPFFVRLVRPAKVRYEREINEVLLVDGDIAELKGSFDHYPFSKGLDHWIAKHNQYSRMEAEHLLAQDSIDPSWAKAFFVRDFNERRRHQKALFYRLPGRPLIKFAYMMIVRRAFLDGRPGIQYALLQSIYEYLITLKAREIPVKRIATRTQSPSLRKGTAGV